MVTRNERHYALNVEIARILKLLDPSTRIRFEAVHRLSLPQAAQELETRRVKTRRPSRENSDLNYIIIRQLA